jgi:hypothetical protein
MMGLARPQYRPNATPSRTHTDSRRNREPLCGVGWSRGLPWDADRLGTVDQRARQVSSHQCGLVRCASSRPSGAGEEGVRGHSRAHLLTCDWCYWGHWE